MNPIVLSIMVSPPCYDLPNNASFSFLMERISAAMLIAISSGVSAPMSTPTGLFSLLGYSLSL
jgi:hypothetical protein